MVNNKSQTNQSKLINSQQQNFKKGCQAFTQDMDMLVSDQFLRNYTYLQYALFPQLFKTYLSRLTLFELRDQLISYVGILLDFFNQRDLYKDFHFFDLAKDIQARNTIQSINSKITLIRQIQSVLWHQQSISDQITNLNILYQLIKSTYSKKSEISIIRIQINKNTITKEIFSLIVKIAEQLIKLNGFKYLFDLSIPTYIYVLISQTISDHSLSKIEEIKTIKAQKMQLDKLHQKSLIFLIRLEIIPYQIEMKYLFLLIKKMKIKEFYLFNQASRQTNYDWYWYFIKEIKQLKLFLNPIQTAQQRQSGIKQAYQHKLMQEGYFQSFEQIFDKVYPLLKTNKPTFSINQLPSQIQVPQNRQIESKWFALKQLSSEAVQRLSKKYLRIRRPHEYLKQKMQIQGNESKKAIIQQGDYFSLNDRNAQPTQKMQIQGNESKKAIIQQGDYFSLNDRNAQPTQKMQIQGNESKKAIIQQGDYFSLNDRNAQPTQKMQIQGNESKKAIIQQGDYFSLNDRNAQPSQSQNIKQGPLDLSLISSQFLQNYTELFQMLQHQSNLSKQSNTISKKQQFTQSYHFILNKMQYLQTAVNDFLQLIINLNACSLRVLHQHLQQSKTQISLVLEMFDVINLTDFEPNTANTIIIGKLHKIYNSVLINSLTVKILIHAFQANSKVSKFQVNSQQTNQFEQQFEILNFQTIQELFEGIFQFINEKQPKSIQFLVEQKVKKQIKTFPYLKNIIFLFSSIQIWYQLKDCSKGDILQILDFFNSVIKRYSLQQVKIENSQQGYVNYIILMCDILKNEALRLNDKKEVDQMETSTMIISKLFEIKNKYHTNYMKIQNIVNLNFSLGTMIQNLAIQIFGSVFPQIQIVDQQIRMNQQVQSNENINVSRYKFDQRLFKISFWKSISCNRQQLNRKQMVNYLQNTVFGGVKKLSTNFISSDQLSNIKSVQAKTTDKHNDSTYQEDSIDSQKLNLFALLVDKHQSLQRLSRQFQSEQNQYLSQDIFANISSMIFSFIIQMVQTIVGEFQAFSAFQLAFSIMEKASRQSLTLVKEAYTPSLLMSVKQISKSILFVNKAIEDKLITTKLRYFKLSPNQIHNQLLRQQNTNTQISKQQVVQRAMKALQYMDEIIGFGMFGLSMLLWMKQQLIVKYNVLMNQSKNTTIYNSIIEPKLATISLLRWMLVTGLSNQKIFRFNYEYLEAVFQSKVQNDHQSQNVSLLLAQYLYSPISFSNFNTKTQLNFANNYQLLEFLYEYFPFKINSYQEQLQMLNECKHYVKLPENHQFIGDQKNQKVKFAKLCQYLQLLKIICQQQVTLYYEK